MGAVHVQKELSRKQGSSGHLQVFKRVWQVRGDESGNCESTIWCASLACDMESRAQARQA